MICGASCQVSVRYKRSKFVFWDKMDELADGDLIYS